jgi:hypothetical protein
MNKKAEIFLYFFTYLKYHFYRVITVFKLLLPVSCFYQKFILNILGNFDYIVGVRAKGLIPVSSVEDKRNAHMQQTVALNINISVGVLLC